MTRFKNMLGPELLEALENNNEETKEEAVITDQPSINKQTKRTKTTNNKKKQTSKTKNTKNDNDTYSEINNNINDNDSSKVNTNTEHKDESEILLSNTETEDVLVLNNSNNSIEHTSKTLMVNNESKLNEDEVISNTTIDKLLSYNERRKQLKEETHARYTVLIRKDLLQELDELSKGMHRGFKTEIFNVALEEVLEKLRSKKES